MLLEKTNLKNYKRFCYEMKYYQDYYNTKIQNLILMPFYNVFIKKDD